MGHACRFLGGRVRPYALQFVLFGIVLAGGDLLASQSAGNAELFDRLDSDRNGRVTASEVTSSHERVFQRLLRRGDVDGDKALTRDEFLAALVPSRPEKEIEAKLPATFPQADAVRWLLLTMDTSGNSWIEAEEVPQDLKPVFERMVERLDGNKNGVLERVELSRGGPPLAQIAGRFVQREGIDVAAELRKLERTLGKAANRFELQRVPLERLGDPKQAREIFGQLDGNGNGQIEPAEVPEPFQRPLQRLTRFADRNGDGRLSEREFLTGGKRLAQRQAQQAEMERKRERSMPDGESMSREESMPGAESTPAK